MPLRPRRDEGALLVDAVRSVVGDARYMAGRKGRASELLCSVEEYRDGAGYGMLESLVTHNVSWKPLFPRSYGMRKPQVLLLHSRLLRTTPRGLT